MSEITEGMIERAGRALCELGNQRMREAHDRGVLGPSKPPAPLVYEEWREAYNEQARVALEAALND